MIEWWNNQMYISQVQVSCHYLPHFSLRFTIESKYRQINFPPMRALEFIIDHVIFKICYNQIDQLKTPSIILLSRTLFYSSSLDDNYFNGINIMMMAWCQHKREPLRIRDLYESSSLALLLSSIWWNHFNQYLGIFCILFRVAFSCRI